MKDLWSVKKIIGIRMARDKVSKKLYMSQQPYIEEVLERFNTNKAKAVNFPLSNHFKFSSNQSSSADKEEEYMSIVPYASIVENFL